MKRPAMYKHSQPGKFEWSKDSIRLTFKYIHENQNKQKKGDWAGLIAYLRLELGEVGVAHITERSLKMKLYWAIGIIRKNKFHTTKDVWQYGPGILKLDHEFLEGAIQPENIEAYTEASQAALKHRNVPSIQEKDATHEVLPEKTAAEIFDEARSRTISATLEPPSLRKRRKVDYDDQIADDTESTEVEPVVVLQVPDSQDPSELDIDDEHLHISRYIQSGGSTPRRPSIEENLFDDEDPTPTNNAEANNHVLFSIPGSAARQPIWDLYHKIGKAVDAHLIALNLEPSQAALIDGRGWADDLTPLMQTVFGTNTTPQDLASAFAQIQAVRTLPLQILLRSLIAAALKDWIFEPDILIDEIAGAARAGRELSAFKSAIRAHVDEQTIKSISHTAKRTIISNVEARAGTIAATFAGKLYIALSQFFRSSNINQYSFIPHHTYLEAGSSAYHFHDRQISWVNRTSASVNHTPDDSPLPGSTRLLEALCHIFTSALQLRLKWYRDYDAIWLFDFPPFKAPFREPMFNEEYVIQSGAVTASDLMPVAGLTTGFNHKSTELRKRVWVCTMFGVSASFHNQESGLGSSWQYYSRPVTFNLD